VAIIYPVRADAPQDFDRGFDDFASDLSDAWVVDVRVADEEGDESDPAIFGPFSALEAWELANDLEERAGSWLTGLLKPLYPERDAESILSVFMAPEIPGAEA
jgi:hypothetical protein